MRWAGMIGLSALPFAAYIVENVIRIRTMARLRSIFYDLTPNPTNYKRPRTPLAPPPPPAAEDQSPPPATLQRQNTEETGSSSRPAPSEAGTSSRPSRRRSTISSRGEDDPSDDDEAEGVSATLISFDVEATESSDVPTGSWSAELRPNVVADPRTASATKDYADNWLTRFVPMALAQHYGYFAAKLLFAPATALTLRAVARSHRVRHGLPVSDMWALAPGGVGGFFSSTAAYTWLSLAVLHYLADMEMFFGMCGVVRMYKGAQADWGFWKVFRWKLLGEEVEKEDDK
jgi:hypothetical protein